jgi:hypothetical protein
MTGKLSQRKKKIPMMLSAATHDGYRLSIEFGSGSFLDLNMQNNMRTNR